MSLSKNVTFVVQLYLDLDWDQLPETEDWVKERLDFFQRYALRSLQIQTFQDFRILLLCGKRFKHITSKWALPSRVERAYDMGREFLKSVDTDYISITRIDTDDIYHKNAMENVRDKLVLSDKRECLIFREGYHWDILNRFLRMNRRRPSPPFYTHIFPKTIYKNWQRYSDEHFMGHGKAGGRLDATVELPKYRFCVIRHDHNVGLYRREIKNEEFGPDEMLKMKKKFGEELITNPRIIEETLEKFGVAKEDVWPK